MLQGLLQERKSQRQTSELFPISMPQIPSDQKEDGREPNAYLKYSSLGLQLLAAIGIFGWLGHKLDNYLVFQFPVFMLLFGFLGFAGMMIQVYRSINQE